MNDVEKTKFLFEQTCVVISGALAVEQKMPIPADARAERFFDAIYPMLEKKLEEKLAGK